MRCRMISRRTYRIGMSMVGLLFIYGLWKFAYNYKLVPYRSTFELKQIASCYEPHKSETVQYFDDIFDADKLPVIGKTIFFHETTCSKTGIVRLNSKQACAIESAAKANPNRDIFVLFFSPVGLSRDGIPPKFYEVLGQYPNIYWRNVNLWRYSNGTPIEEWLDSNQLFQSQFLFEHMSDVARGLSLFNFGGYHMDLDVIVLKNIDELGEDFIPDDWGKVINGAFMHLNNHGVGKKISKQFLYELRSKFDAEVFIANGPTMLTGICERICKVKNRKLWTPERCQGFTLKPKELFYPIPWNNYSMYFDPNPNTQIKVLAIIRSATLIHVWNDRSKDLWNVVGTNNAYQVIAERKCPNVYRNTDVL